MRTPDIACKIIGYCTIQASEDPEKIHDSLANILPESKIKIENDTAKISSNNIDSLGKIFETIHSRKTQRAYLRRMRKNMSDTSTWFYLNKQAAFANNIALCDEAEESPLGPIKIIIESNQIDQVMEWLTME